MDTKICSKCKEEKEICEFGKDSTRKGGLSYLCKKCLCEKSDKYRENNKEKIVKSLDIYRKKNKEILKIKRKKYISENKEKIKDYGRYYSNKKRKESDLIRVSENIRRRINHIVTSKQVSKKNKTINIIGCSFEYLFTYLETQFVDGMNWENYGLYGWHIDHIIPLSSAQTEEEVHKLCHYTNLQPLWAKDNLRKHNKMI